MLLQLRQRTEDKETQTSESLLRTFAQLVEASTKVQDREPCAFLHPKNAWHCVELGTGQTKDLQMKWSLMGGRARGQQTIGDFWQCVLESNVAIFIHVLECCMGDMYW